MTIPINDTFSGVWHSHYRYPSSSRAGEFENEHLVRIHQRARQLIIESVPGSKSYLILRLSINDGTTTGSWEEQTEQDGYYKGATYYGAIQLVINPDKKHMSGKWVGFGRDMELNTGPWEFTYIGPDVPKEAKSQPAS